MAEPLNNVLYRRLKRCFGSVQISGEGEAMIAKAVKGLEGEPMLEIAHNGEYYRVNCPFCNDTKHRLYVSHMFGQKDGHGRSMTFMANCFNEFCMKLPNNREKFSEQVFDTDIQKAPIKKGVEVPEEAREVDWPGPCVPINKLKPKDEGRAYLSGRDFDVDRLYKKFGVTWCVDSRYSLARNRITIPVFEKGKLKGWQCRFPADLDWKGPKKKELPPKYFSCPGAHFRSKCIYNFDEMKKWETGIIVEGPSDVWRFGMMAGCIFGNTVTEIQRKKLLSAFSKRTLVMLLDPEEFDSKNVRRNVTYLEGRMPGRFCAVKLPDGTDPGSLDKFFLREYVRQKAAKQGVKVSYKRAR